MEKEWARTWINNLPLIPILQACFYNHSRYKQCGYWVQKGHTHHSPAWLIITLLPVLAKARNLIETLRFKDVTVGYYRCWTLNITENYSGYKLHGLWSSVEHCGACEALPTPIRATMVDTASPRWCHALAFSKALPDFSPAALVIQYKLPCQIQ